MPEAALAVIQRTRPEVDAWNERLELQERIHEATVRYEGIIAQRLGRDLQRFLGRKLTAKAIYQMTAQAQMTIQEMLRENENGMWSDVFAVEILLRFSRNVEPWLRSVFGIST
jgi:hypothetical protein